MSATNVFGADIKLVCERANYNSVALSPVYVELAENKAQLYFNLSDLAAKQNGIEALSVDSQVISFERDTEENGIVTLRIRFDRGSYILRERSANIGIAPKPLSIGRCYTM